ncbi:MAG: sugar ABC transporter permease [Treponema sp.]|jgi:multiple sugar transport system permease protein|nr:sugar ABC transporter permease [Treponema sp.]
MTGMKKSKDWLWAVLFIGPTVIGVYLFYIYPIFGSVYISFTKWNHLTKPEFIGLANYINLFKDPGIAREFFNTIFFVVILVPLVMAFSLLLANFLNKKSRFTGFFRTAFFLPYVILPVVTAITWYIMFNSRYGLINMVLGRIGLPQPAWLANEALVRIAIIIVTLWGAVGYYAVIILAGLQNIPKQYYEACELDGGGPVRKFLNITVPLVTPQLFFVAIVSAISLFQMFDYVFIFGKSNVFVRDNIRTMAYGIYERGFTYLDMGYASAEAIVFCVLVLIVTVVQNAGQKKWVHYG